MDSPSCRNNRSLYAPQAVIGKTGLDRANLIITSRPVFAGSNYRRKLVFRRRFSGGRLPLAPFGGRAHSFSSASDKAKGNDERHPPHNQHP